MSTQTFVEDGKVGGSATESANRRGSTFLDSGHHDQLRNGTLQRRPREAYTVGWICAVLTEYVAAQAFLDEMHGRPNGLPANDYNDYALGRMGSHDIVITVLPLGEYGIGAAASAAKDMHRSFPQLKFALMVGIGGGVPTRHDVRLGDIVVSQPREGIGGVFQYDFGKTTQNQTFHQTGSMDRPPRFLLSAVHGLKAQHTLQGHQLEKGIDAVLERNPELEQIFGRPDPSTDVLYRSDVVHPTDNDCDCDEVCGRDPSRLIPRKERRKNKIAIHYGLIASANQVMKDAMARDRLATEKDILCFEMEAAGLMNILPCLVVRGICDYSDSHKNHDWQGYAALAAASYAKDLLSRLPPTRTVIYPEYLRDNTADKHRKRLMGYLAFEQIDVRQKTIENAHVKTCKWLLEKQQYCDWLAADKLRHHFGFLWIKGKPGTGKSTLMKYAMENCQSEMKDTVVISFFFSARGAELERSTVGMYRSLLLQLLRVFPRLQHVFDSVTPSSIDGRVEWKREALQALFEQAVQSLGDSSLICFIDALDECPEEEIRAMMSFFETLSEAAVSSGLNFRVCLSSRHYPHITMNKGLTLILEAENGHDEDITNYVETELKIGQTDLANQIRSELQEKSSGVFMWVVLVVSILNKHSDKGRMHQLRKKLHETPAGLHDLFRDILTRGDGNNDELLLCVQWVLFARRALSPRELFFAIISGTEPDSLSEIQVEDISEDASRRFVLDCSKGLTEITAAAKDAKRTEGAVQFIHESVRDFLLKEKGLEIIWEDLRGNIQGSTEERLKQCCSSYLVIMGDDVLADNPGENLVTSGASARAIARKFPFFEYSIHNILQHSNAAESHGMDQANFVQDFQLTRWTKLSNLVEDDANRDYNDPTLLYIFADHGLASLIRHCPYNYICFANSKERLKAPVLAALVAKNRRLETLQELLRALERSRSSMTSISSLCEQFYKLKEKGASIKDPEHSALDHVLDALSRQPFKVLLSAYLVTTAHETIPSEDLKKYGGRWISRAIHGDHDYFIERLLDESRKCKLTGEGPLVPLWKVSENKIADVARLLAHIGPLTDAERRAIDQAYPPDLSLLIIASRNGHADAVKLLLDAGFKTSHKVWAQPRTALAEAVLNGHHEVVRVLLDGGAAADANGFAGSHALMVAINKGDTQTMRQLLEGGVDPQIQCDYGSSCLHPLDLAIEKMHVGASELLLQTGASVSEKSLIQAVKSGQGPLVKLLLNAGGHVDSEDAKGQTPLSVAACCGNHAMVALLLECGAAVNPPSSTAQRPLCSAAELGHTLVVDLLLDKGASIGQCSGANEDTALAMAVQKGHLAIVELLLKRGGKIHSKDSVMEAVSRGHQSVVELVLASEALPKTIDFWGWNLALLRIGGFRRLSRLVHIWQRERVSLPR